MSILEVVNVVARSRLAALGGPVLLPDRPVGRLLRDVAARHMSSAAAAGRSARLALLGALVCGLTAPVALLADLHQPGRFWRFYLHPNLSFVDGVGLVLHPGLCRRPAALRVAVLRPDFARTRAAARDASRAALPLLGLRRARRRAGCIGGAALDRGLVAVADPALHRHGSDGRPGAALVEHAVPAAAVRDDGFTGAAGLTAAARKPCWPCAATARPNSPPARWLLMACSPPWCRRGLVPHRRAVARTRAAEALARVAGHAQWRLTAVWAGAATAAAARALWRSRRASAG